MSGISRPATENWHRKVEAELGGRPNVEPPGVPPALWRVAQTVLGRYEARREQQRAIYDLHTLAWWLAALVSFALLISGALVVVVSCLRDQPVMFVLGALLIIGGEFCGSSAHKLLRRRAAVAQGSLELQVLYFDLVRAMAKGDEGLLEQTIVALASERIRDEVKRELARAEASLGQGTRGL